MTKFVKKMIVIIIIIIIVMIKSLSEIIFFQLCDKVGEKKKMESEEIM